MIEKLIESGEAEGGCGVIGVACSEKIAGRHILPALFQMRNRGNGKGGGIAAAGLDAKTFGVTQAILNEDYLLAIAYLNLNCKAELEREFIHPLFEIDHQVLLPHIPDYRSIPGLDLQPPEVTVYFIRVKKEAIHDFKEKYQLHSLSQEATEDEIVYQNTYYLNLKFYAAEGEKRAFVLSHAKNLLVLKMVGFGDDVIRYYQLANFKAHVWIGHHRYPTKGKVWHPGGAHPFIGMHEALVHNGDFANYFSICEYLAQRNIHPLFLTDTEVSVLLFDLFHRIYKYPLEYVIEALAPTTEWDFTLLPKDKQEIYRLLQNTHIHGSPDGPWFFLIAQSHVKNQRPLYRLTGITDTSMLRPQVFALQQGEVQIGFSASEKQAIDATLKSLSDEDYRFWSYADHYWSARGGSYSDGGAFSFTVIPESEDKAALVCTDKFGNRVAMETLVPVPEVEKQTEATVIVPDLHAKELFLWVKENAKEWDYGQFRGFLRALKEGNDTDKKITRAIDVMTHLLDRHYPLKTMRRSYLLALIQNELIDLFGSVSKKHFQSYAHATLTSKLPTLEKEKEVLIIDATGFTAEGKDSLAEELIRMHHIGFKRFIIYNCHGQRFIANGFGPNSQGVKVDVYGSSGDYLSSGIDGAEIIVHGNAQDQLAQIMKSGTLVVHGDIGQTFMYGAKGGTAYICGNAAGRPLINAVGKPRVVINGTCLDYLAESFMAGNPLKGGGFAIVNGVAFDPQGNIIELESPYPGTNIFSLASGGAIYLRDPAKKIKAEILNGGEFVALTEMDWELILPYLKKNEELFDIPVLRLLEYKGKSLEFSQVYRKIAPISTRVLQEEEAWVKGYS